MNILTIYKFNIQFRYIRYFSNFILNTYRKTLIVLWLFSFVNPTFKREKNPISTSDIGFFYKIKLTRGCK